VATALSCAAIASTHALADATYQPLPFTQDWTNAGLLTVNDDWSGVPGIIGYRGDDITAATGVNPQTLLAFAGTPAGPVVDINVDQTNPNTFGSGGVTEFAIANPVVAFQGSGTADAPFLLLHLNTLGQTAIEVSYNLRDIDGSVDNSIQQIALQYRTATGPTDPFIDLPAGYVADASTGPSVATLVTAISVTLPTSCENQATLQLRIITTNAVGNDEMIGVDDIAVTGTGGGGSTFACSVGGGGAAAPAGGSAFFTYTLLQNPGAIPVVGTAVTMTVLTGPDAGATQTINTDSFGVSNFTLTSGGMPGTDAIEFSAATTPSATICSAAQSFYTTAAIVINEVDSDTPSADTAEFVELYDGGAGNTLLDGLSVHFWNGSNDKSYAAFDLAGKSTNAQGYFVIGNAAIVATLTGGGNFTASNFSSMSDNTLQNGADAVGLYTGNASSIPVGSDVTTAALRDAVVYGTNDPDAVGLLVLLNAAQPQVDESGGGNSATQSVQRCPNGSGGLRNTTSFAASLATPGAVNSYTNVPTNVGATPASICAGDSSLLLATVGTAETVVWYEGSCGGTIVGEGGSISVSPVSTTTYFAAAKNVNSGCISATCVSVEVAVTSTSTWYLDQDLDGFGDPRSSVVSCTQPRGYVGNSGDGCPVDPAKVAPGACGCGVFDTDSDSDGTADCVDGCPNDPNKIAAGACGCGALDTDSDGDGTANCIDGCPSDPNKIAPGTCGCGVADIDTDTDGTADCNDGCPTDPLKIAPGVCGCGVVDADIDGDGTVDCLDGCPNDPNKSAPGICGCGTPDTDSDSDGVADCLDVCPGSPDNVDCNGNGTPDGCDISSAASADVNENGIPDECDCLGDLDNDGQTNGADLAILLGSWGTAGVGDINVDGTTNGSDLAILLGGWGPCPFGP